MTVTEKPFHIHFFPKSDSGFAITEFGHSRRETKCKVPANVRHETIFHFVIKGVCRFCAFDAEPGEAFMTADGVMHSFSVDAGYEHYWFCASGDKMPLILAVFGISGENHGHFEVKMPLSEMEKAFSDCFAKCAVADEDSAYAMVSSLFFSLLPLLRKKGEGGKPDKKDVGTVAAAFMERCFYRRLPMTEVAAEAGVSEKYLCRLFKKKTGMPPVRYLASVRMKNARRLLETTPLTVAQIASATGFPSQPAFSESFRKYYGVYPSRMREEKSGKKLEP